MVENKRNLYRFSYIDNAIFQPSKMELVICNMQWWRYFMFDDLNNDPLCFYAGQVVENKKTDELRS